MTTTAWAHLPNATHIDRVIADVGQRPEAWAKAWSESRAVANHDAWGAAVNAAWGAARDADKVDVWGDAFGAVLESTREQPAIDAAWDAIYALVAWDHSAALIGLSACTRVLASSGDPIAILMLPTVLALKGA